jgi:hypothetical protein
VSNRIARDVQDQIVEMALDSSELSPRELAVRFTDERHYLVSEATVYRLLEGPRSAHQPGIRRDQIRRPVPNHGHPAVRDVAGRLQLLQDHRVIDGTPLGTPTIPASAALTLTTEPQANVERYDTLLDQRMGHCTEGPPPPRQAGAPNPTSAPYLTVDRSTCHTS